MVVRQDSSFDTYGSSRVRGISNRYGSEDSLSVADRYSSKWVPEASSSSDDSYASRCYSEDTLSLDFTAAADEAWSYRGTYEYDCKSSSFGTEEHGKQEEDTRSKSSFNTKHTINDSVAAATLSMDEPSFKQIYDTGTVAKKKIGSSASTKTNPLPFGQKLQALKQEKSLTKQQELIEMTSTIGSIDDENTTASKTTVKVSEPKRAILRAPLKKASKLLKWRSMSRSAAPSLDKIVEEQQETISVQIPAYAKDGTESAQSQPTSQLDEVREESGNGLPTHLQKIIAQGKKASVSQSRGEGRDEPPGKSGGEENFLSAMPQEENLIKLHPPHEDELKLEGKASIKNCESHHDGDQRRGSPRTSSCIEIRDDCKTAKNEKDRHMKELKSEGKIPKKSVKDDCSKPMAPVGSQLRTQLSVLTDDVSHKEVEKGNLNTPEDLNNWKSSDSDEKNGENDLMSRSGSTVFAIRRKIDRKAPTVNPIQDDRTILSVFRAPARKLDQKKPEKVLAKTESEPESLVASEAIEQEYKEKEPTNKTQDETKTISKGSGAQVAQSKSGMLAQLMKTQFAVNPASSAVSNPTSGDSSDTIFEFEEEIETILTEDATDTSNQEMNEPKSEAEARRSKSLLGGIRISQKVGSSRRILRQEKRLGRSGRSGRSKSFHSTEESVAKRIADNSTFLSETTYKEDQSEYSKSTVVCGNGARNPEQQPPKENPPTSVPVPIKKVPTVSKWADIIPVLSDEKNEEVERLSTVEVASLPVSTSDSCESEQEKIESHPRWSIMSFFTYSKNEESNTSIVGTSSVVSRKIDKIPDDEEEDETDKGVNVAADKSEHEDVDSNLKHPAFGWTFPSLFSATSKTTDFDEKETRELQTADSATEKIELGVSNNQVDATMGEQQHDSSDSENIDRSTDHATLESISHGEERKGEVELEKTPSKNQDPPQRTMPKLRSRLPKILRRSRSRSTSLKATATASEQSEKTEPTTIKSPKSTHSIERSYDLSSKAEESEMSSIKENRNRLDLTPEETEALLRSWRKADQRKMMRAMDKIIDRRLREIERERQEEMEEIAELGGVCCAGPADFSDEQ